MKNVRRALYVLKRTGAINIFFSFMLFIIAASILLMLVEPEVKTVGDGLWYSFVAATTIGFGDICVVTIVGRVITVLVGVYGIFVTAMATGVIVSYYMEYLKIKEHETISTFLEELEHLPEFSKEQLEDLSARIKKFNKES